MPLPAEPLVAGTEVAEALTEGRPLVALETAVLTHGLPRPTNLETAIRMQAEIRRAGATPATIGVVRGRWIVGLSPEQIESLGTAEDARKLNARDLAPAAALGWTGGTTVSATMALAHAAGLRVLATGGIGGVHPGPEGDVSTDLPELERTPVAVVCSGAKAILDLPRTLETLETLGVPVVGWKTDRFPEFFSRGGDLPVSVRVDRPEAAARLVRLHLASGRGLLVCVPCPERDAVPSEEVRQAVERARAEARERAVAGKELTPYLLGRLAQLTDGATLRANQALLVNNARVATEIAAALSG